MRLAVVGVGARGTRRAESLRALPGVRVEGPVPAEEADDLAPHIDAAFVAVSPADHYRVAAALARRSVSLFLDWPPATSVREGEALVRLAEEAGVEVGVSRPLRRHPLFTLPPDDWRPALVVLHRGVRGGGVATRDVLADAVDVCCALVGGTSVQRVEAEAARGTGTLPEAAAFGLRFHSGAYAQVALVPSAEGAHTLYAAGGGHHLHADLDAGAARFDGRAALAAARPPDVEEAAAFLAALADGRPPPVSALDGLQTMRLVERLIARLR